MKFSVALTELQKGLQKTLPAIPPKSTLPVLEHLHFSLNENILKMIATDQDITILTKIDVIGFEDGDILVPARKINEIVKALGTEGEIEFISDPENFEINLKTDKGFYEMKGLSHTEYLDLPELFKQETTITPEHGDVVDNSTYATIARHDLQSIANKTVFAVSSDEFRPAMTGVLLQFKEDAINAVSTDSYRLVKTVINPVNKTFNSDFEVIIPAKSVEMLKKIDDDAVFSLIESSDKITHVRFEIGNTIVISRIIDEKFPPYESVIPQNNNLMAIVDKKDLLAAIRRVSIFTNTHSKQIKVKLTDNMIEVMGEDEDSGNNASESIACDFQGESIEFGFNYKYLEDALNHTENVESSNSQVMLTFSEPTKPALVKPTPDEDKLLMLIMPVRLS